MSFTIGLWNANGLQASSVDDVLQHSHSFDILFITETWLLPPSRLPTTWTQFHNYGQLTAGNFRGTHGITALISPSCTLPVLPLPITSKYLLSFRISSITIVCCYFPPSVDDVDVFSMLGSIPLDEHTIICGDFNARMSLRTGDHADNVRGRALDEWLTDHQLCLWNTELAHGIPTFTKFRQGQTLQSIIDLVISNLPPLNASMTIRTDLSLGSDHHLLSASFDLPPGDPMDAAPPTRRMWNLTKLQESDAAELYETIFAASSESLLERLRDLVDHPPSSAPDIDQLADSLNELIYDALSRSVGDRQPRPKHWKWFWSKDLAAAAAYRDTCYRKWRRAVGLDKAVWWTRHREAHLTFRLNIKAARRRAYRSFCDALERDFVRATSKIKVIRRRRQQTHSFVHPDGPSAAAAVMSQHLSSVCDGRLLPPARPIPRPLPSLPHPTDVHTPFDTDDVEAAIRQLPNRKAPGSDHLRAEMLKPIVAPLTPLLHSLYIICWQWSYVPPLWRHAQVCPIFKKGDPTMATNYRPISLTSILRKAMEYCLAPLLSLHSPAIDLAQGGFRPRRSAMDQALCLHEMMHLFRLEHHRPPVIAFLDIKAAYDTVDRNVIWTALAATSTPPPLLSILRHLFDDVTTSVLLSNHLSPPSSPATGVLQGSVLSPHLYSIYINTLPSVLRAAATRHTTTVGSPPTPINSLLFADDVALIGTPTEVQQMLDIAASHSLHLGYRWSPTKCAVLNGPPSRQFTLYDEALPMVDEFIYLGVPFQRTGMSTSSLLAHRTNGTLLAMSNLQAIGARPSGFSQLLGARLYRTFIRPKFEYALAISNFGVKEYKDLERIQDRCLRMLFGGHRLSSTAVFRQICNLPTMRQRTTVLVFKFCLRLHRLPPDCLISLLSPLVPYHRLALLRRNILYKANPPQPPPNIKQIIRTYRQEQLQRDRNNHVLISGCRPTIGTDPILTVPATRRERSRLLRWRLGWLPGKPRECSCGTDHVSRRHIMECPLIPAHLWDTLPLPPPESTHNAVDFAISALPASPTSPPPFWSDLLTILLFADRLIHPDTTFPEEPVPGSSWIDSPLDSGRSSPSPPP